MSKPTLPIKGAAKKTALSDRDYASQAPAEDDIASKDDGGRYLPIDVVERDLDRWPWSTQNFRHELHKDHRGNVAIGASIELVIPWTEDGRTTQRTLTGCCNFYIGSYAPNGHFVATAKSECVKNAASDLGPRFGRGLNQETYISARNEAITGEEKHKFKPDKGIWEQWRRANEKGDKIQIDILANIYDFNIQENEL